MNRKKEFEPTPELRTKLSEWISSKEGENAIETAMEEWYFTQDVIEDVDTDKAYGNYLSRITHKPSSAKTAKVKNKTLRVGRWTAAMIILLLAGAGTWFVLERNIGNKEQNQISRIITDVTLTLSDGAEIFLDRSTENSRIALHNNVAIIREGGTLIAEKQSDADVIQAELQWGTIKVPRGAQFDIVLEDGTHIWLNANSRLRFPISFAGHERRVFLEGEGYFTVTENAAKPFVVETAEQTLAVLGTEFNVYAYPGEADIYTTLVTGSVGLKSKVNMAEVVLRPGQQARLAAGSADYSVTAIDVRETTVWRNHKFVFEGIPLDQIFARLQRWYDFEYDFEDTEVRGRTLRGALPIYDDISAVLEMIETAKVAKIVRKGNKIIIMKAD